MARRFFGHFGSGVSSVGWSHDSSNPVNPHKACDTDNAQHQRATVTGLASPPPLIRLTNRIWGRSLSRQVL